LISAANDIQVTDTHVIADRQLLNPRDHVQMTDLHVIFDGALVRVDDAKPDANSFADLISKEQTIKRAFQKGWQNREHGEHQQTRSACFIHLGGEGEYKFLLDQLGVRMKAPTARDMKARGKCEAKRSTSHRWRSPN
jgi:hypothetical protein